MRFDINSLLSSILAFATDLKRSSNSTQFIQGFQPESSDIHHTWYIDLLLSQPANFPYTSLNPSVVMHLYEPVKLFEYYLKEGEGEGHIFCNTH